MPQLRQNIVTGDWVVIAPERAKRPSDFVTTGMVRRDHRDTCVFCINGPEYRRRLKGRDLETDHLYVIPNKFPAFVPSPAACQRRSFNEEALYISKAAVGGHEVLIIKDHDATLFDFSEAIMADLLRMWRSRYHAYAEAPCRPEYLMGIYNHGQEAGASIWHPHAQLFASAIVPNHIVKEKHGAERYFESNGTCVFCDVVHHEVTKKFRLLDANRLFVSFTAYAARFPFEIWILPKTHASRYELSSNAMLVELADILKATLARLNRTLHNPPLNIFLHSLPHGLSDASDYHWHIELAPRLTTYGGFELGGSTIIDIVSPEKAAEFLR